MAKERVVRMYSRQTCGLCDEARAVIVTVRREVPFGFHEISIDGDDALELAYGLRIPVVEVNGQEEFELTVDAERLRVLLLGESL